MMDVRFRYMADPNSARKLKKYRVKAKFRANYSTKRRQG